jgi:hypothetical protein
MKRRCPRPYWRMSFRATERKENQNPGPLRNRRGTAHRKSQTNSSALTYWSGIIHPFSFGNGKIRERICHPPTLQREIALRDQRPYLKEYNTGAGGPANSRNPQGGIIIKR